MMKTWKISDLKDSAMPAPDFKTVSLENAESRESGNIKVAIIGGGPKGMYALDSLRLALMKNPLAEPLEIYWFNENMFFGAGNNYRTDQPDYLLINYCIGNISIWKKNDATADFKKLNLTEWIARHVENPEQVQPKDYASRALVGCYLQDGARAIIAALPSSVTVRCVLGEVHDMAEHEDGISLSVTGCNYHEQIYQSVMLATGHANRFRTATDIQYAVFTENRSNVHFIDHVYPVTEKLAAVPANNTVAIKGIGLTFIDALLALTEGRGGKFVYNKANGLAYLKSGNEPKTIYPFSRSGMPMLPRGPVFTKSQLRSRFIHQDWVDALLRRKTAIDFESAILPRLQWEFAYAYYTMLFQQRQIETSPALEREETFEVTLQQTLAKNPDIEPFVLDDFLFPSKNIGALSSSEFHNFVISYLETGVKEAAVGEQASPLMALVAVWREALPFIGQLYAHGGFTAKSQQLFDQKYLPAFNRVSFGPPLENVQKILALARAGILKFHLGADITLHTNDSTAQFDIASKQTTFSASVDMLIDARIPKPQFGAGASQLYQNMYQRKLAVPFTNQQYRPGCPAITAVGNLIDARGNAITEVTLSGTPTEGATLDNDSLSRARNDFAMPWAEKLIAAIHHQQKQPTIEL